MLPVHRPTLYCLNTCIQPYIHVVLAEHAIMLGLSFFLSMDSPSDHTGTVA
jgi:hypothetical protein